MPDQWSGRVDAEHLGGEAVLLDLGTTYLVSDHPQRMGGSGRGPTPGEMIKGALSSSIALALGAASERGDLPPGAIRVSSAMEMEAEPLDGPLSKLIYLSRFIVDVAVSAPLSEAQARRAQALALDCRVARAIAGDLLVEEENIFRSAPHGRPPRPHVALVMERTGVLASNNQPLTGASCAEFIGGDRALATWGGLGLVLGAGGSGPAPEDLLLSSLAVCTTVFAARAVERSGAEADVRTYCAGRLEAGDAAGRLERGLEVVGDLTPEQREMIDFCANHCVLGETLRRRAELRVNVRLAPGQEAVRAAPTSGAAEIGAADCDDGTCCVPDFAEASQASGR